MKKVLTTTISIVCLMAIYNILVFCLTKNLTQNFWTGYIFVMLGFVFMLVSFALVYGGKKQGEISGLPIKTMSVLYFILMVIIASSLMFLNISFLAVFLPLIIISLIFVAVYVPAVVRLFTGSN